MSTTRYNRDGLNITTYVGPKDHKSPNSNSQIRVQMYSNIGVGVLQMTMDQWIDLVCFIREMDARNEGILSIPECE